MTDVYTLGESARFLSRDLESVMRLVETGQLPCTQAPDGEPFVTGQNLVRFAVANFGKPR